MPIPSLPELLGFIASHETLERTLGHFPGLTRERLRALLREAAVLLHAEAPHEPTPAETVGRSPPPEAGAAGRGSAPRAQGSLEDRSITPARRLRVYSDGAARGNPGPAGAGAVIAKADGTVIARLGKYLGHQTNNFAEYRALLLGLEAALELGANEVDVFADSELLVRQLKGEYKVKSETLRPLYRRALELLGRFRRFRLQHVPREMNADADEMSNRAIDEKL